MGAAFVGAEAGDGDGDQDVGVGGLAAQGGQAGADAAGDAEDVDAEGPLPVGLARLADEFGAEHAGVEADEVERAEFGFDAVGEGALGGFVGHVELDGEGADLERFNIAGGRSDGVLLDVGQDDVCAFACEGEGDAASDAAAGAGDERGFAAEVVHVASPSLSESRSRSRPGPRALLRAL